jgi:voltage-gated potassium channel
MRLKVYNILSVSKQKSGLSFIFDMSLTILIVLNVAAIVIESIPSIGETYSLAFYYFEMFSVAVFTLEYVLRVWSIVENEKYSHPFYGRLRFIFSAMALIDLFSILPFFLARFTIDLRYLRILRLFRIFRLFKVVRYVTAINAISIVVKEKREQLIVSIVFILFMLLIVSSVMYYVENDEQPEAFSSIPHTMWWGVATLTTVGYGDVYPITGLGKFLGGVIAILGVGLFALPTGILASGFSDELEAQEKEKKKIKEKTFCPYCGENLKD